MKNATHSDDDQLVSFPASGESKEYAIRSPPEAMTREELVAINEEHGEDMNESDLQKVLSVCNKQHGMNRLGVYGQPDRLTAQDWAIFYAKQDRADAQADYRAVKRFHSDAYGDD